MQGRQQRQMGAAGSARSRSPAPGRRGPGCAAGSCPDPPAGPRHDRIGRAQIERRGRQERVAARPSRRHQMGQRDRVGDHCDNRPLARHAAGSGPAAAIRQGAGGQAAANPSSSIAAGGPSGRKRGIKRLDEPAGAPESITTTKGLSPRASAGTAQAIASKLVTPSTGMPSARPKPRAAARPTRMPVNDPGPTVTPTASSAAQSSRPPEAAAAAPAANIVSRSSGIRAAAWPRPDAARRWRGSRPACHTAAEHPGPLVSMVNRAMTPSRYRAATKLGYDCVPPTSGSRRRGRLRREQPA